ncbi:MAG: AAA-like domain-containing protein [Candidatus Acidiferrales bacterium]
MNSPVTPAASPSFYVIGGTLKRGAACYVQRQADADLHRALEEGKFCYVLTSRQMGKSSLMVRTAVRLREEGVKVAVLDLTALGLNLRVEQWYLGLLNRVGQQLDLEDELLDYWEQHSAWGPLLRWTGALREVVLEKCPGRVVIFVDEIDATRSLPFSADEFFAAMREFYNRRTEDPELSRLTLCLFGVATPSDLIKDVRTTPFNIGQRIELTDFSERESEILLQGLGRDEQTARKLLGRILYWTGGHPYLTQRLCQAVADSPEILNVGGVDRLCEELFLSRSAREKDDNLLFVRDRILRSEADRVQLLEIYRQIREQKTIKEDPAHPLHSILRLSGITRIVEGFFRVRNRIYYRVFDREWVQNNLPVDEVQRQRAAYRRGVRRTLSVAASILFVMGGLTVWALRSQHQASESEKKAHASEEFAIKEQHKAETSATNEQISAQRADKEKEAAVKAELDTKRALLAARQSQKLAAESEEKWHREAVRIRGRNLEHLNTEISLADSLISLSPPERAYSWHEQKAGALLEQGNVPQAEKEADIALAEAPFNPNVRTTHGYAYLLDKQPQKALEDFDYIDKSIDAHMALNHLNQTVVLALLDRNAEARAALQKAVDDYSYGGVGGGSELEISPDIEMATGRTAIVADADAMRVALRYLQMLLSSYTGDADFDGQLAAADKAAKGVSASTLEDAYLTALNWAWLQETVKTGRPDYGAKVGQAALWERLKHPDWAACYYQSFEEQHRGLRDVRFNGLAAQVRERLAKLGQQGEGLCQRLRAMPTDPRLLQQMAREKMAQTDYLNAELYINLALKQEPENTDLLLLRDQILQDHAVAANIAMQDAMQDLDIAKGGLLKIKLASSTKGGRRGATLKGESEDANKIEAEKKDLQIRFGNDLQKVDLNKQKRTELYMKMLGDSETILRLNSKTPSAYYGRALAYSWTKTPDQPYEKVLDDFRTALKWDATSGGALWELQRLLGGDEKTAPEALEYAQRYNRLYPGFGFAAEAKLHNQLKQYSEALDAVEHAIAMDGANLENYDIRAEAERGLGLDEHAVLHHQADGYMQAHDILKRRGEDSAANSAYENAWALLEKIDESKGFELIRCNPRANFCETTEAKPSFGTPVAAVIDEILPGEGKTRIVQTDRGSEDGYVVGAQGELFSRHEETKEHTRPFEQIGRMEVLSVESHSSKVRVTMDNPEGDGLVRQHDLVQTFARVPKMETRSDIWHMARFHIEFQDEQQKGKFFDYAGLHSAETPELVNGIYDKMLTDIHENAGKLSDPAEQAKPIAKGKFAGKTPQQALESSTRDDLIHFFTYLGDNPVNYAGYTWKVPDLFLTWVQLGAPEK